MNTELSILAFTSFTIGFLHTVLGPDHYIPFVAMSKAGKWSMKKTVIVTALSGVGHVLSSILLGMIGIALGTALTKLEAIESYRGEIAAWLLITFGLIYTVWGLRNLARKKSHTHWHKHEDGVLHTHQHSHRSDHAHVHENGNAGKLTPWILFTIFIFGPCEALIPLLMYPAANIGVGGIIIVTAIFAATTILTMVGIVTLTIYGIQLFPLEKFERYSHVIAGMIIVISGISVQFLGL